MTATDALIAAIGGWLAAIAREATAPLEAKIDRQTKRIEELEAKTNPDPYQPIPEAARFLKCSAQYLRKEAKEGRIPSVKIGRSIRVDVSALAQESRQ